MAQVNSSPGQNQIFGNVIVVPSAPTSPTQAARAQAIATVVAYSQSEPGAPTSQSKPKRS